MSDLGPEARSILGAGRNGDDPTPTDRARVRRNLARAIAAGGAAAAASAAGTAAEGSAAAATAIAGKTATLLMLGKIGGGLVFVAALGAGIWFSRPLPPRPLRERACHGLGLSDHRSSPRALRRAGLPLSGVAPRGSARRSGSGGPCARVPRPGRGERAPFRERG